MTCMYARCAKPQRPECQGPQIVIEAVFHEGRLVSKCRHCRGDLKMLDIEELRAAREQRAKEEEMRGGIS